MGLRQWDTRNGDGQPWLVVMTGCRVGPWQWVAEVGWRERWLEIRREAQGLKDRGLNGLSVHGSQF